MTDSQATVNVEEIDIPTLQAWMTDRRATARMIVEAYIARVAELDGKLHSVLEVNPDALSIADQLDAERAAGKVRGPLHGIPILLKDNIDTADQMETTAGSLALLGSKPAQDATISKLFREAGAILLGKANMSEWANFRSTRSSSGWSGRGRQCRNPYSLDRTPGGSSSGSGVAAAASLCAAAIGTETNGSIVSPAAASGVVGIKPTIGLSSRAGIIPISHTQDTPGPLARTVTDAAIVLGAMTGVDSRDEATADSAEHFKSDYTPYLDPNGLHGARIGVARSVYFGYSEHTDALVNAAIDVMRERGAVIVDPANIPTAKAMAEAPSGRELMFYEFKADLNAYLAERNHPTIRTLADVIAFNLEHAADEMPYYRQELLEKSEAKGPLSEPAYLEALENNRRLSRTEGIDAVMDQHGLDLLIAPTASPPFTIDEVNGNRNLGGSSTPAALAGYPLLSMLAGYTPFGLPVNLTLMGRAWSEPVLIRIAYALEQALPKRRAPGYLPTLMLP
ncbi:MAG: amidase [Chloroflexota bacterium]